MSFLKKTLAVVAGSFLIAAGINLFLVPLQVLDGGVIGIALIINYLFRLKIGLIIIVCSIPIFIAAWFYSRPMVYNSMFGMIFSSYMIDRMESYQYVFLYYVEWTPLARSAIGGMLIGLGLGIMLRYKTSTGGTDLLAHMLAKRAGLNVGVLIALIDGLVISIGGILLQGDTFPLSVITIGCGGVTTSLCTIRFSNRTRVA
ncbi:YitT family protein [Paenibacillus daejeonensis]|uniref:YitT family protein n=1 Tax=Paenibacillus daejeonensis TaxID=135193 RepID=UPI0003783614|nr:YitT family protein [Paenibacillus daejeonensis]